MELHQLSEVSGLGEFLLKLVTLIFQKAHHQATPPMHTCVYPHTCIYLHCRLDLSLSIYIYIYVCVYIYTLYIYNLNTYINVCVCVCTHVHIL